MQTKQNKKPHSPKQTNKKTPLFLVVLDSFANILAEFFFFFPKAHFSSSLQRFVNKIILYLLS